MRYTKPFCHALNTSLAVGLGMRSIAMSVSLCMSVSLLGYLKNDMSKLRYIFCACYPWPWLEIYLTTMQYVMYFRFCE